ncbi:MAG: ABC transporter substrate-binding protein [Lachnospiraceae bacterium]|nr:ABC transporter substrate-binding protein [Lachnospiraceae bacterium]
MKRIFAICLAAVTAFGLCACSSGDSDDQPPGANVVRIYNWGEYIDEDVIGEFEEETGIKVIYDTFSTNEEMYPRIEADPSLYDVICPSEYMVEKMKNNGLLQEIDHDRLENYGNLGQVYLDILDEYIDPGNKYMVPYCWGTVGILYNTTLVDEEITSWTSLWDPKYSGSILMQDSVRDAFMVAEKILGYSANTKDEAELEECRKLLKEQYPLVKAYVIDEVRDKMIAGYTALGVIYSGEYLYCSEENEDLAYCIPEEGSNIWYDGWVITKNARNVDAAYKWIDYMLRGDIAARNFDYITYSTPNEAALEYIDEEILEDPGVFPDEETIAKQEMYMYLGEETEDLYYEMWKRVK